MLKNKMFLMINNEKKNVSLYMQRKNCFVLNKCTSIILLYELLTLFTFKISKEDIS